MDLKKLLHFVTIVEEGQIVEMIDVFSKGK